MVKKVSEKWSKSGQKWPRTVAHRWPPCSLFAKNDQKSTLARTVAHRSHHARFLPKMTHFDLFLTHFDLFFWPFWTLFWSFPVIFRCLFGDLWFYGGIKNDPKMTHFGHFFSLFLHSLTTFWSFYVIFRGLFGDLWFYGVSKKGQKGVKSGFLAVFGPIFDHFFDPLFLTFMRLQKVKWWF